jgi:2-methylisocitrate lyase-like PEP mutase family enzyme
MKSYCVFGFDASRSDARGLMEMQGALDRCLLFKETGADILFVAGPPSLEELKQTNNALGLNQIRGFEQAFLSKEKLIRSL